MINLHEIMAELYSVGKKPTRETIDEIIAWLEAMGNNIPPSEQIRREHRRRGTKSFTNFTKV